jgi:hypothetical protein
MKVRLIKEACSWPHEIGRRHVGTFSPPKRSDAPSTSACHARAVARCIWAALAARHYTVYDVEDSVNRGKVTALRPKKASCLLRLRPGLSVMSALTLVTVIGAYPVSMRHTTVPTLTYLHASQSGTVAVVPLSSVSRHHLSRFCRCAPCSLSSSRFQRPC